ncbi:MAG: hypothetical protein WC742_12880 [Gallionellaceae bacterium]|jgi:hypothetical protein
MMEHLQERQVTVVLIEPKAILASYDILLNEDDFFISVNGVVKPSDCSGFSVDENECLVFHQDQGDVVSYPVPDTFKELIASSKKILFVRFEEGDVEDACELTKEICYAS